MNRKNFFNALLVLLIFIAGCARIKKPEVQLIPRFKIPVIVQDKQDSAVYFSSDSLVASENWFMGKYRFTDTLKSLNLRSINDSDYFHAREVDDNPDSFASDGFQIYTDYKANIHFNPWNGEKIYYPVYIVNETPTTKDFHNINIDVDAIQEAAKPGYDDRYHVFFPVEIKAYNMCGTSTHGVKVHPGEFVMFIMPKYSGALKTQLRVRVRIGENIYISKQFEGKINPGQFYIKHDVFYFIPKEYFDTAEVVKGFFFGSGPLEFKRHYKFE